MATRSRDGVEPEATFVFKGTVQEVKSSNVKHVVPTEQTLVVNVDQIISAPRLLAKWEGRRVTVQLPGRQTAQAGEELIFHTYGWVFAEGVAVQSVRQEPLKRSHLALLTAPQDPVAQRRQQAVQQRFDDASVVLSGQVATVRLPSESRPRAGRMLAAADAAAGPVSEHTPHWREAVVHIDEVHKGEHRGREIVIRFPASTDVRWYRAPKFEPGQQGHFMVNRTKVEKKVAAGKAAAKKGGAKKGGAAHTAALSLAAEESSETEEVYTALHPMDYQPYGEAGGINSLLETETEGSEG